MNGGNGTGRLAPEFGGPTHEPDGVETELDLDIDPPIEWNGETYKVLHLVEPTGKQIHQAEAVLTQGNYQALRMYQFALISIVTKTPRPVIESMRISQINRAMRFLRPYIADDGPEIGAS